MKVSQEKIVTGIIDDILLLSDSNDTCKCLLLLQPEHQFMIITINQIKFFDSNPKKIESNIILNSSDEFINAQSMGYIHHAITYKPMNREVRLLKLQSLSNRLPLYV